MKPGAIGADPFGNLTDTVRMNPPAGGADLVEPAGPIDPDVSIVAVKSREGRPIALLANYSLHYVGGPPAKAVSADYFGEFAQQIQQRIGAASVKPPFVGIMSNGTSGDINNINFRQPRQRHEPFEQIRLVAGSVAETAYDAYQTVKYHDWVPLAAAQREIELGVRLPSDGDVAKAKRILEAAKGRALKERSEIYARETVLLSDYPPTVKLRLQALRIGELGIAAIPCETFVQIGLAIKENSPLDATFTIELANLARPIELS
jgi:hypothetical protein